VLNLPGSHVTKSLAEIVKTDLERVGGDWRTTAKDSTSWKLLIEVVLREKMTVTTARLTPDDRVAKRRTTIFHLSFRHPSRSSIYCRICIAISLAK